MNRFKLCLSLIGFIILTFCAGFRTDYAAAAVAGERVDMSTIGMGFSHLPQELQAAFSAAAGHDDAAYAINRAAVGYHGANMRHNLSLDFSNEGLTVRQENSQWRVRLNKVGYGNDMHVVAPCGLDAAENRVEFRYAGMKEWYINGPMGLEQGFTIDRSPGVNNGGRPLTLELLSSSDFRPVLDDSGTGLLLMGKDDKQVLRYGGLSAVDAAGRRLHAWLESDGLRLLLRVEDVGAIYPLVIDPMIQQQKLTASDGVASDSFGSTVALSADGSTALISAEGSGSYQGAVYVFVRSGATWAQQQKLTASDGAAGDSFGSSVALSADGNTALIGAYLKTVSANFGQGVTYVFVRSGTTWTQQPELTATDGAEYDNFGASVAISADGNTALIGAPYKVINTVNDQGAAYVFVRSGTTWIQQPALIANNGAASDYFGTSVALSGDGNIALIGAEGKSSSRGSVYVFTHGTSWTQLELTASDGAAGDSFGTSVAISRSGTAALVGASYAKVGSNSNQGAAYAFSYSGGWSQQKLTAYDGAGSDHFGWSVTLSADGHAAIIGAPYKTVSTDSNQGAAYMFSYSGGTWSQQGLSAADGVANDYFGWSVALSADGDTAIIGAHYKTIGSNSNQGAAYMFTASGLPSVDTLALVDITTTTADVSGDIASNGGYSITAAGVCWSSLPYPVISDSCTNDPGNPFVSFKSGLNPGQTYHARAYAINSQGIGYGNDLAVFTLCSSLSVMVVPPNYPAAGIQDAINNVSTSGAVIEADSYEYVENPVFSGFPVTLQGGYDCSLGSVVGFSKINGQMTIQGTATVTISNIIIGP